MVSATWFQSVEALPAGAFLAVVVVVFPGAAVVGVTGAPGAAGAAGVWGVAAAAVVVVDEPSTAEAPAVVVVVDFSTTAPATTGLWSLSPPRRLAMASR